MWKRATDIVVSLLVLVIGFPVFLILAIAVRLSSPGPIIYRSKRSGRSGKPFDMYKFRSMYPDADKRLAELRAQSDREGPIFKMKNDPRITPIGRFIRKTSLDELPQFINVLIGDMSLIGPRALPPYETRELDEFGLQRLRVNPGITCYWQISGRSNITHQQWMELDNKYIDDMSFGVDIVILFKTPRAVLKGEGAY
ncbi:MAG: sugar transferase [Fimbriimonas sp.]